jgi:hypothetical protein
MLVNTTIADCYQELFNHFSKEHNVTLTISEMDEIVRISLQFVSNYKGLGFEKEMVESPTF